MTVIEALELAYKSLWDCSSDPQYSDDEELDSYDEAMKIINQMIVKERLNR